MKLLSTVAGLFLVLALLVSGCATTDPPAGTAAVAVNEMCPISGMRADPSVTVSFQDQDVAFCCPKCKGSWEEMGEEARAEKLAKVKMSQ